MGRKLGLLVQLVAGLAVFAIMAVVAETMAGFKLESLQAEFKRTGGSLTSNASGDPRHSLDSNPVPLQLDSVLLWRNQAAVEKTQAVDPQSLASPDEWTLRLNAEGFRGPARPAWAAADVFRVVCLGDSVTFGFNVDQGLEYPRQLERFLRERHPGRQIEVVNAAVVGWTWAQGVRFLDRYGRTLEPDLVVMAYGVNDQFWVTKVTDREQMWLLEGFWDRVSDRVVNWALNLNTIHLAMTLIPRPPAPPSPACELQELQSGVCRRVSLDEMEVLMRSAGKHLAEDGIEMLILNLDFLETSSSLTERRVANTEGWAFLDEAGHFRKVRLQREWNRASALGVRPAQVPTLPSPNRDPASSVPIVLRVMPTAAKGPLSVVGRAFQGGYEFEEVMHDDGAMGDEKSGDGVFSVTLQVPPESVGLIQYLYVEDGQPEFVRGLARDSLGSSRRLRFSDTSVAFIDRVGERDLMVENVHPNADGHLVIAEDVADYIEGLPSFQRFVEPPAASAAGNSHSGLEG